MESPVKRPRSSDPDALTSMVPRGSGSARRTLTWWITNARRTAPAPPASRDNERQAESGGGAAHAGTILRPSALPATTSVSPPITVAAT